MVERFWGEMGYVRVAFGARYVVSLCFMWATVQSFTTAELNYQVHCHEGGDCCGGSGPAPSSSPPLPTTYFYLDSGAVRGVTVVGQSPGIEGVKACVACRAWTWASSWPSRQPPASLHQLAEFDVCCWCSRRMACPWLVASTRGCRRCRCHVLDGPGM